MIGPFVHSAVLRLIAFQSRGRLRRMWRRFLLPRRLILSVLAILLAIAWLGNAAMTIWYRESASSDTLRATLSFGFMLYAIWHITKVAFFRPEDIVEWIPAERELLLACPLHSGDLLAYKLASVATSTVFKSIIFALLLLPDLRNLVYSSLGILLAVVFLELLRMIVEMLVWGMSQRAFWHYRSIVSVSLLGLGSAIAYCVRRSHVVQDSARLRNGVMNQVGEVLVDLDALIVGWATLAFRPFTTLIIADRWSLGNALLCVVAFAIVALAGVVLVWLFDFMPRVVARRETHNYQPKRSAVQTADEASCERMTLRRIPRLGGAAAVAWRQLLGARRHLGGVLTALIVPGMLAMTPTFVLDEPMIAFLSTAGALAFYTFILLPTALRFDFRRDLDRLTVLKSLPISAGAAVAGQIAVPVIAATLFQAVVLACSAAVRSQPLVLYFGTLLVFVPTNLLVFVLDNLIFLLYPYRIEQEGLEIFLRTMLTFTAKGILFVLGLGALSAWGYGAALVARSVIRGDNAATHGHAIFSIGMWLGISILAVGLFFALRNAYRRLDPVEDVPR